MMSRGSTPDGRPGRAVAPGNERGIAVVLALYGLSVFSVLALTVLQNATLESALGEVGEPDMHIVLYAGGAGSAKTVGRLNLPTTWRLHGAAPDDSVTVLAPGPVGIALTAEMPEGWAYAVRLTKDLRVCCDAGGSACANVPWHQQVPDGTVTPAFGVPRPGGAERRLQFDLSSHEVPRTTALERDAVAESAFLLKVARVPGGPDSPEPANTGAAMVCTMQTADRTVATGTLALTAGVDREGRVNRVAAGSFALRYSRPQ